MNVIIAGAGEVGIYIAEKVTAESHDVTIIEIDPAKVREISNTLDVNVIPGNASSVQILKKAMVQHCDLFLSLTNNEEVNIVSASIANRLGAKKTIARFDNTDFRKTSEFSYQSHFGINEMFSSKMFASLEMDSFIRNPGSLAIEHFAQGTVIMRQVIIDENSRYIEKEVSKLDMPKDVKIACITRDGRLIIPKGDTLLKAGDSILLIGETEKINKFQKNFKWGKADTRKIVILGGGRITLNLARRLNSKLFRLSIIERDPWRCERLSAELPYATVLQGDGTKLELLMEEHVETADFFIAATANDEINIMSVLQVKKLGVKKTAVLIHKPDFVHLIEDLGIDHAVSPRAIMAREILTILKKGKEFSLADMGDGEVQILELHLKNINMTKHRLKEISSPKSPLILLIKRQGKLIIPSGETMLELDDVLLMICKLSDKKKTIRLFGK